MQHVYFATNRNHRRTSPESFGGQFNPHSADSLRFGRAAVSVGPGGPSVQAIEINPERISKDPNASVFGSRQAFDDLGDRMRDGIDVLVFIHGYNVSFEEALETGALLGDRYGAPDALSVVAFSWPSDGKMTPILAYKSDRADARASAPAFARGVLILQKFLAKITRGAECPASIHLMAHSMGNYVLRNGIQEIRRHAGGSLPKVFDQIFLMAADEDHDAFEHDHKLQPLPQLGAAVNVYFNRGDTALVMSDHTKSNVARLGTDGPRLPLNVPGNVTLVDASGVVGGLLEHSYFWNDPRVVRDVTGVLTGTRPDRIAGRGYLPSHNRYVLE